MSVHRDMVINAGSNAAYTPLGTTTPIRVIAALSLHKTGWVVGESRASRFSRATMLQSCASPGRVASGAVSLGRLPKKNPKNTAAPCPKLRRPVLPLICGTERH